MSSLRMLFVAMAALSLLLTACGDDDAVGAEDAGSGMDAAAPSDASTPDAGSPDDGGSSGDAGASGDAGVWGDAGGLDAGVEVDAGPPDLCASVDCSGFDDACNAGTCDPSDGTCSARPLADGTTCDDGNAETSGDECFVGMCQGVPLDTADEETHCRYAAWHPGYLDSYQDPSDGSVLFCHKDGMGRYGFVNSSYSSCLTHWSNHRSEEVIGGVTVQTGDVFPSAGCGA